MARDVNFQEARRILWVLFSNVIKELEASSTYLSEGVFVRSFSDLILPQLDVRSEINY